MFKFSIEAVSAAEALAFMAGLGARAGFNPIHGSNGTNKVQKVAKAKPGKRQRARNRASRKCEGGATVGKLPAAKTLESKGSEKAKGKGNRPPSQSNGPEGSGPREPETVKGHWNPKRKSKSRKAQARVSEVESGLLGPKATSHQGEEGKEQVGFEGAARGKLATGTPGPSSRTSANPATGKAGNRRQVDVPDQESAKKARLSESPSKEPERTEKWRLKSKPMEVDAATGP